MKLYLLEIKRIPYYRKIMKTSILFVIDSLGIGGAEKSLVTLLNLLDYSRYDVDLQLFKYGGKLTEFLPKEVTLLPPFGYTETIDTGIKATLKRGNIKAVFSRLLFSYLLKKKGGNPITNTRLCWQSTSWCYKRSRKNYDLAVAYGQGLPTFYVAEKVKANRKAAWINARYILDAKEAAYQEKFYHRIDHIVCVSDVVRQIFTDTYPGLGKRTTIIKDIIDARMIQKMVSIGTPDFSNDDSRPILVTAARLERGEKGYDILMQTARILKERGITYRWIILGKGSYRWQMEQFIKTHGLTDMIELKGEVSNPYPYIANATVYVQTSRSEGFGLSIAEARLLNIPVVTTAYDGWEAQMVPGKNGIVVPISPEAVADAIVDLLEHPEKREAISAYQRTEKKGNTEEIDKFYALL